MKNENILEYAIHFGGSEVEAGFETREGAEACLKDLQSGDLFLDAYVVGYAGLNQVKVIRL